MAHAEWYARHTPCHNSSNHTSRQAAARQNAGRAPFAQSQHNTSKPLLLCDVSTQYALPKISHTWCLHASCCHSRKPTAPSRTHVPLSAYHTHNTHTTCVCVTHTQHTQHSHTHSSNICSNSKPAHPAEQPRPQAEATPANMGHNRAVALHMQPFRHTHTHSTHRLSVRLPHRCAGDTDLTASSQHNQQAPKHARQLQTDGSSS